MSDADKKTGQMPITWWHSLMYATSILLVVCGIPATVLLAVFLPRDPRNGLARADSFMFGLSMIGAELLIAGILHLIAERVTKHNLRTLAKTNEPNVAS